MKARLLIRYLVIVLVIVVIGAVLTASAASNTVPITRLADQSRAITANELKPAACAALDLTAIYYCTGNGACKATDANELVLGNGNGKQIRGLDGDDCIVGGEVGNTIDGGAGNDVCIGGPGGTSYFNNCETIIP